MSRSSRRTLSSLDNANAHQMCELRPFKCAVCGSTWLARKKLASCESSDMKARCRGSLCMYVGDPRKPQRGLCEVCRRIREGMVGWGKGLML